MPGGSRYSDQRNTVVIESWQATRGSRGFNKGYGVFLFRETTQEGELVGEKVREETYKGQERAWVRDFIEN